MVEGYRTCVLTQEGFNNRRQIEYRSGVSNEFAYFVAGNSWKVVPFIGAGNSSDCQAGASGDDDFWFAAVTIHRTRCRLSRLGSNHDARLGRNKHDEGRAHWRRNECQSECKKMGHRDQNTSPFRTRTSNQTYNISHFRNSKRKVRLSPVPIDITDRYKLIFEEHHYASDFRAKIVQAWCLFYAAFAAGLAWTQANVSAKPVSWVLSAFAFVITIFIWAVDFRHRKSLAHSKQIGRAIEESRESAIPESQRFFASIKSGWLTHSLVIDMLSGLMFSVLLRASCFLKSSDGGALSSLPPDIFLWAVIGIALGVGVYL